MINVLTDARLRRAAYPGDKMLNDGGGLYFKIRPSGSRKFEFRYSRPVNKKRNWLFVGDYPDVSLKDARLRAIEFRNLVAEGVDPQFLSSDTGTAFGCLADDYFMAKKPSWSAGHYRTQRLRYDNYIAPLFFNIDIKQLTAVDIFKLLDSVASSGSYQTAEKLAYIFTGIFNRAKTLGIVELNPALGLMGQVAKTSIEKPMAHFNLAKRGERERFASFLNDIDSITGCASSVKSALILAPYVFLRPTNLVELTKSQVNIESRQIEIARDEMKKMHSDFIVPMSNQVLKIVKDRMFLCGDSEFIFNSPMNKKRGISTASLNRAKKRVGWGREDATVHGLRHTATTWLSENGFSFEATELQLHHKVQGVRGVYNRAEYLGERREMMQAWADFIDEIKG